MSLASIVKMIFSLFIVSVFVAYAFSQSANQSTGYQRNMLRTPLQRPPTGSAKARVSNVTMPNITPSRGDSVVERESVSDIPENFDTQMYFRTPDPSITPPFSKKDTLAMENSLYKDPYKKSMPKAKIPEVTPRSVSVQTPKIQTPPIYPVSMSSITTAYREVAPDSTEIRKRMKTEETPLMEMKKEAPYIESFPNTIPIPKMAHAPDEEKMPQSIEDVVSPSYKVEQNPEYAPFIDPLLSTKRKEDDPEIPPNERVAAPVEEAKIVEEKIASVQNSWSIAAAKDKHPPQEEKLQQVEREESIALQSEAASVPLSTKQTVDVKTALADDGTFIQLASYTKQDDARYAATSPQLVTKRDNIFVYKKLSSQYYKLVVGPFTKDDVGVQLLSFNRNGFSDAFVLKK